MSGTIVKLVIFSKQGKDQALVQFERPEDAATAMDRFQGKNISSGCNTLNIQYSNLGDITVKYNDDRSYDFTNPNLPASDQAGDALLAGGSPRRYSLAVRCEGACRARTAKRACCVCYGGIVPLHALLLPGVARPHY